MDQHASSSQQEVGQASRHHAFLERLLLEAAVRGYHVTFGPREDGLLGVFQINHGTPSIFVFRANGAAASTEPLDTLFTLAHEYGHALAWEAGYRKDDYLAVVDRAFSGTLSENEALLILDEECRAWLRAAQVLAEYSLSGDERTAFANRKCDSLVAYCQRMGLADDRWRERERTCDEVDRHPPRAHFCDSCAGERWQRIKDASR
jgi:hypothetical protein